MKRNFLIVLFSAFLLLSASGLSTISSVCEMQGSAASTCCKMPESAGCCEVPVPEICACPINAVPVQPVFVPVPAPSAVSRPFESVVFVLSVQPEKKGFPPALGDPPTGLAPLFITNRRLLI